MEVPQPSAPKHWTENVLIKAVVIGVLILFLMIPSIMISELVRERSYRKQEVVNEISSKWGSLQTISGPYIQIPYLEELKYNDGKNSEWREHQLYYFPTTLDITGDVMPVVKKRSIFKAILYEGQLNITGTFEYPDLKSLQILPENVQWEKASMNIALTDLRGISSQVNLTLGDTLIKMTASAQTGLSLPNGLRCLLPENLAANENFDFKIALSIKGSQGLFFSPVARTNTVKISSSWPSPKFEGQFLPDTSTISDKGFEANWTVLDINRQISQQWTDANIRPFQNMDRSYYTGMPAYASTAPAGAVDTPVFGVELLDTVDHYTKNERTVKYAFLLITLTFVVYFFCEVLKKQKVHPLQYALVGAAIVIFFILLLSLSEQIGFDAAYAVSSIATILLITFYSRSIFTEKKFAWSVAGLMFLQFGFIYVILQLEDFALLAGSIALFLIIALIMYLTRKVKWS